MSADRPREFHLRRLWILAWQKRHQERRSPNVPETIPCACLWPRPPRTSAPESHGQHLRCLQTAPLNLPHIRRRLQVGLFILNEQDLGSGLPTSFALIGRNDTQSGVPPLLAHTEIDLFPISGHPCASYVCRHIKRSCSPRWGPPGSPTTTPLPHRRGIFTQTWCQDTLWLTDQRTGISLSSIGLCRSDFGVRDAGKCRCQIRGGGPPP